MGWPAKCFFPPPGGFKVQQVQQIHKRPGLQDVSEILKVQYKCNKVQREGSIQFSVFSFQFSVERSQAKTVASCKLQVGARFQRHWRVE